MDNQAINQGSTDNRIRNLHTHTRVYYNSFGITRVPCAHRSIDESLIFSCAVLLAGIMTLTSSPCELDNMSLFQDLKLKRRKVDSRCSSDGKEAIFTFRFAHPKARYVVSTSEPSSPDVSSLCSSHLLGPIDNLSFFAD